MGILNIPRRWNDQKKLDFARKIIRRELRKIGLKVTYGAVKCTRKPKGVLEAEITAEEEWGATYQAYKVENEGEDTKYYLLVQIYPLDFEDSCYESEVMFEAAIIEMLKHELVHMFFKNKYPESIVVDNVDQFEERFARWVSGGEF